MTSIPIDRRTLQHPTSPRREIARDMKQKGLTYQEIADQMNISRQRAQQLVRPTDKKRKEQLESSGGICESCGQQAVKLDAHHENYEGAPTQLLCVPCHKKADAKLGLTARKSFGPLEFVNCPMSSETLAALEFIRNERGYTARTDAVRYAVKRAARLLGWTSEQVQTQKAKAAV